jgi:hypothetical protein
VRLHAGNNAVASIVATVLLILVTACSGGDAGDDGAGDGGDTASAEATSTTVDPRANAVLQGYEAYWAALLAAADPVDPNSAELAAHATGDELEQAQSVLSELGRAGDVMRGSYGHDASVQSIDESEAVVADCLAPRTTILDAATGEVTVGEAGGVGLVTVQMALDGDVWKVALIEGGEGACTADGAVLAPEEATESD